MEKELLGEDESSFFSNSTSPVSPSSFAAASAAAVSPSSVGLPTVRSPPSSDAFEMTTLKSSLDDGDDGVDGGGVEEPSSSLFPHPRAQEMVDLDFAPSEGALAAPGPSGRGVLASCTEGLWNAVEQRRPLRADGFAGLRGDVEVRLAGGGAAPSASSVDFAENMRVMKDAVHLYSQDAYFETGVVTALVRLQDGEEEDDAVIVSMTNVHKTYLLGVEGVPALRGVTLGIRRGEFVCVYGTSGGGKTS